MKTNRLNIGTTESGKGFTLPPEIINQSVAILAKRRVGKSYTTGVIVEELLALPQQVVIIDPTGVHWGLRSSSDGRKAGFPIVVIGGKHADIPLEEGAGEMLARAIIEQKFSAIIDTSLLKKGQTLRFLDAFLGTIYHLNEDPLFLGLDEVDYYCPQKPMNPQAAITASHVDDLVRRGGVKGIGVAMITQRSSVVAKDVLTQCEVLITLRLVHPLDIKAVMDWIATHGDPAAAKRMTESLPALPVGTAWFWWPSEEIFERVKVRTKTTFDSGKTPKPGEKAKRPKVLAKIDLQQLGEKMKATVEAAKANSVTELRKRISELQGALERKGDHFSLHQMKEAVAKAKADAAGITDKELERKLDEAYGEGVEAGLALAPPVSAAALATFGEMMNRIHLAVGAQLKECGELIAKFRKDAAAKKPRPRRAGAGAPPRSVPAPAPRAQAPNLRPAADTQRRQEGDLGDLEPVLQRIVDALLVLEGYGVMPAARTTLAMMIKASPNSSGFQNNLGKLRTLGLLDYPSSGLVALTDAGRSEAVPAAAHRSLDELHSSFMDLLDPVLQRILKVCLKAYPKELERTELAEQIGASASSSGFQNNLGKLRTMGVITYPSKGLVKASELLFPEGLR